MLSIIIISYNVKFYLRQCIRSIYNSKIDLQTEIIVVDNDSFDNSSKMIEKEFPNVILLKNKKNLGFSKAVNQGAEIAKGEFVCLVNPDSILKNNTLNELKLGLKRSILKFDFSQSFDIPIGS